MRETETIGSTSVATDYVWGSELIGINSSGQQSYVHADGLGSIKALTGVSGVATDTYAYDAFGNPIERTGMTTNPYRYAGEYFDDTVALEYHRARWLDVGLGRFVSQDQFAGMPEKPMSLNKYLYVSADPVNLTDPSGFFEDLSAFGRGVEREVIYQYQTSYPGNEVVFGRTLGFIGSLLKPDIQDFTLKTYQEIKPLSPSGIVDGIYQMEQYDLALGFPPFISKWKRGEWTPPTQPVTVEGGNATRPVVFFTTEGIVFYTDDAELAKEASGIALVSLEWYVRDHARGMKSSITENAINGGINSANLVNTGMAILATAMILWQFKNALQTKI